MKKYPGRAVAWIALLLAALLVLGCAGCSRADSEPDPTPTPDPQPTEEPTGVVMSREPPAMDLWQALEFTLNDTPLQLPLTLEQLQELGFEIVPYEGETFRELNPGLQVMFFMTHPDCEPYHVLEGVLTNPDGGETSPEQWPVQSITFTILPQLENAQELMPP